jgi:integrase
MPIHEWPAPDREAWAHAVAAGATMLDESGPAAAWRRRTRQNRIQAYGRFLTFLARHGQLDPQAPPHERPTPERIDAWVTELRRTQRASTVARMLLELSFALGAMVPHRDWRWIARHPACPSRAEQRDSRRAIIPVDVPDLLVRIEQAYAALEAATPRTKLTARRARDLTMMVLLAYTGLRTKELMALRLSETLVEVGDVYRIEISPAEHKTKAGLQTILAAEPARWLRRYLSVWRPILIGTRIDPGAVWANADATPVAANSIHPIVRNRSAMLLGRPIYPHLFRHSLATGLLTRDPFAVRTASAALGHRSTECVDRTYDRAGTTGAQRVWCGLLRRLKEVT